jgi:two-component system nitrate/nitrite response regulator NarL
MAIKLTPAQQNVVRHLARGLSNKDIAAALGIGEETVKVHMKSICRRLKKANRVQVVLWAIENGYRPDLVSKAA